MPDNEEQAAKATIDLQAKWYVVGFPKAGTHFAVGAIRPLAKPMPKGLNDIPWASGFNDSMTHEERHLPVVTWQLSELRLGHFFKGHTAWSQDLEAFLWYMGACVIFVYRDPRDVAVSLLYHVLSDEKYVIHSGREKLRALGGKDEILTGIIEGIEGYPGVMGRWEAYAPWLSVPWVFRFKFEDAVADLHGMADRLVRYALDRLGEVFALRFERPDTAELVGHMVTSANDKESSATYRAGRIGDWRFEFNEGHKELFKQSDKNNWLIKLGYESSPDW